ncbi:Gmad2 immunoglobulin-like domain-containing protein [Paenibacillus sp. GCM10023250]|uniref:Gmad2 immunoglobulin-like domain-containing protein n=1 Tax=Paenibacillus sp. GCM10023250 TaxID=3252648 RepID=UPI003608C66E
MTKRMRTAASGAIALTLTLALLAGCSGKPDNVAEAPGKPPAAEQGGPAGSGSGDNGGNGAANGQDAGSVSPNDIGDGGKIAPSPPSDPSAEGGGNGTIANGGTNGNGGSTPGTDHNAKSGDGTAKPEGEKAKIVASNEAFRVYGPAPDSVVGKSFKVKGQARVFEAAFGYSFEDGHNVLAEGHAMADAGAPAWGEFELDIALQEPPSSPTGVLTLYEASAKDGSHVHELHIAYTFDKDILRLGGE